ncbi:hypothetical protein ES702_03212 [subsurface metagenome]
MADPDDSLLQDDTTTPLSRPLLLPQSTSQTLTPLEQQVLNEYSRLLSNMNHVSPPFLYHPFHSHLPPPHPSSPHCHPPLLDSTLLHHPH